MCFVNNRAVVSYFVRNPHRNLMLSLLSFRTVEKFIITLHIWRFTEHSTISSIWNIWSYTWYTNFRHRPRITPIMSGCGMADLMCKDCSYKAYKVIKNIQWCWHLNWKPGTIHNIKSRLITKVVNANDFSQESAINIVYQLQNVLKLKSFDGGLNSLGAF